MMLNVILALVKSNAKAIVAFAVAALVAVVPVPVPADVQVAADALLVALVVWLVPNR